MTLTCGLHPFCLPLRSPIRTATTVVSHREGLLVSLTDNASGHTGWGEASPLPGWSRTGIAQTSEALVDAQRQINTGVSAYVSDGDIRNMIDGDISNTLKSLSSTPHARAGLAGAWDDLQARKSSQPLMSYLAARHLATARHERVNTPVAVRVNALISCVEPETVRQQSYKIAQAGFTALKLKVGFAEPSLDVLRVKAARAGAGAEMELRIDANGAWDTTTAIETLKRVSSQHVAFCEEPVRGLRALASVARASKVPIAADESIQSTADIEEAIDIGVQVVVVKPQAIGGADIALAASRHAQLAGATVVVTSFLDTCVGVAHALHTAATVDDVCTHHKHTSHAAHNNPPSQAHKLTSRAHGHPTQTHGHPTQAHGLATGSLLQNSFLQTAPTIHVKCGYIHIPQTHDQTHGIGFAPRICNTNSPHGFMPHIHPTTSIRFST